MNPYRTNAYDPGTIERPSRWFQRRMPAWLGGLIILLVASGVQATPTAPLRLNGVVYGPADKSIYITNYVVDGTGVVDSTAGINNAIAAASAGSTIYFPAGTYKALSSITANVAGITLDLGRATINSSAANCIVVSASNVTIRGGTLNMLTTGATQYGINPSGTVANLVVQDMTLNGTGTLADAQTGFGNNSGQTLSGIRIRNNVVTNMEVGISLNANLSGSITDALVEGNRVTGSVGTTSGNGYGIHHANGSGSPSQVRIIGNYLENNQRHDIYQAAGSGVSIIGNHTNHHRTGVCAGVDRPSISIGRSSDVIVADNVVEDTCDAAFDVFTDPSGTTSNNVRITNNIVRNWKSFPAIQIGDSAPATDGYPTDVVVSGNHFYTDLTVTSGSGSAAASAIYLYSGKRVTVSDNSFFMTNSSSTSYIVDIIGQSETAGTTLYNDDVRFVGNQAFGSGTGNTLFRLESAACGSNTRYDFWNNRGNVTTTFNLAAAQSNPNIYIWQTAADGLTAASNHTLSTPPISVAGSIVTTNSITSGFNVFASAGGAFDAASAVPLPIGGNATVIQLKKGIQHTRTTVADAPYTALATDYIIAYTSLSAGRTVTLPGASTVGTTYIIKNESAGAFAITIQGASGTVDGAASVATTAAGRAPAIRVYSDGTNYFTF